MNKIIIFVLLFCCAGAHAQEFVAPLMNNPMIGKHHSVSGTYARRDEPIRLPLFEDFHSFDTSIYPIDLWWTDSQAYINNHFVAHSTNKGIATLDVLDQFGKPYHTTSSTESIYCDSLTSYYIDLSGYEDNDSIYLSFAYLCKGLGFAPKPLDSLLIFFEDELTGWKLAGFLKPDTSSQWKYKTIAVTGGDFFYENFRFRIVNKGTIGSSSSHWHVDNIYMNASRTYTDTQMTDVAFTVQPSNMLNDFTSMPFKHFNTDRAAFTASEYEASVFNSNYSGSLINSDIHYQAKNISSGTLYGTGDINISLAPLETTAFNMVPYDPSSLSPDSDGYLSILQTYYFSPLAGDTLRENDSITHLQKFRNYFAYDDGTAEQSYYLNLAPATPGKIAIEYATYVPDTLVGIDIQFARQVPGGDDKEFFIQVYRSIELGGSGGELIYEEEGFYPVYPEIPQKFHTYALNEIVPLGTGIYYIVIMMPASGISDSLMIGLDANRTGANHRYYNVLDIWESSLLEGALMVRPVLGNKKLTGIEDTDKEHIAFTVYPNPAEDQLMISLYENLPPHQYSYRIIDMQGRTLAKGVDLQLPVDISGLSSGTYIIQLQDKNGKQNQRKFIKK